MLATIPDWLCRTIFAGSVPNKRISYNILSINIYIYINLTKSWQQIPEGGFFHG